MADRIQIRGDTAANWTSVNPVLADRELGWERDTQKLKIGDGVTAWNLLSYGGISDTNKLNEVNPSYTGTLTGGTGVVNLGSGQLVKDAAGNLGLGGTPSAWGGGGTTKAMELGNWTTLANGNAFGTALTFNGFYNGTNWIYKQTNCASKYESDGLHRWYVAPSGTAGNPITFTQAMTLDASGNLAINGLTATGAINLQGSSTFPTTGMFLRSGDNQLKIIAGSAGIAFGSQSGASTLATLTANSVLILENSNGQLVTGQLDANTAFIQSKTSGGSARAIAFMGASEYGRFDVSGVLNLALGLIARPAVNSGIAFGPAEVLPATATAASDNTIKLGNAAYRWSTVYAGTGTINTSDAREKTAVRVMAADEIEAAKALSKEIGVYQFFDSVAAKGDKARHHIGMTVQRAIEIMKFHGLDPFSYGFICYDKWDDVTDADGVVITKAGDRYSFRYDQLTLFIARGIDARLAALEAAA